MENVQRQYQTAGNLDTRISLHAKYSLNPQPFGDWIVSHYQIAPGAKILELGCGNGDMWKDHLDLLTGGASLTLTDFSAGMLDAAREKLPAHPGLSFQVVDIQDIPFPDASFDAVIANMMLYHVPDLHRGLREVRRVLRPGGTFYCATFGQHGIHEYITELLGEMAVCEGISGGFTLQNGVGSLRQHFSQVARLDRKDGLRITDIRDFADYIYSLSSLSCVEKIPRDALLELLAGRMENGALYVPKEYGMFICR